MNWLFAGDVKVVQESLHHANTRFTLDAYATWGLMPTKRQEQGRVVKSPWPQMAPRRQRLLLQVLENTT
jgi:hypothetical protein